MTRLRWLALGALAMYFFDPQRGARRRSLVRDQAVKLTHDVEDAAGVVARDMRNRAQGLAHGDFGVITGKRAIHNPLEGNWSPSARALMGIAGAGLFLYGLSRPAPMACVLGTMGCALAAEGITNASWEDIEQGSQQIAEQARETVSSMAERACI